MTRLLHNWFGLFECRFHALTEWVDGGLVSCAWCGKEWIMRGWQHLDGHLIAKTDE